MGKKQAIVICILFAAYLPAHTQNINQPENMGGGEYVVERSQCLSDHQREEIKAMLKKNVARLIQEEKLKPSEQSKAASPKFKWPLKQAPAYDYKYNYGISNYVDHDPAYPNQVNDYNCGVRTYDNSNGYNHQGTDIFLWPFSWLQMQRKQVKIVAAAPGIIIGKSDGNSDKSCGFNGNTWNAVYVQHADGSVAWYGHMKKGSVTAKNVGDAVALNEKLGFVGSSGNSTGPHLHFEVYDAGNTLVDPWKGPCNNIVSSWWSAQKPYYESRLNTILTQSAAPVFPTCPNIETTNESAFFVRGNPIYFASYYHDQQAGQVTSYKVTRPDNSVFAQWTGWSGVYYVASYWYWWYTLPLNAPLGEWKYEAVFQGDTLRRTFAVAASLAPGDIAVNVKNEEDIKSSNDNVFTLSPNPVNTNLNIKIKGVTDHALHYKIFDINGKVCKEGIVNKNEGNISVTELHKGVYCLQLSDKSSTLPVKKFVKL